MHIFFRLEYPVIYIHTYFVYLFTFIHSFIMQYLLSNIYIVYNQCYFFYCVNVSVLINFSFFLPFLYFFMTSQLLRICIFYCWWCTRILLIHCCCNTKYIGNLDKSINNHQLSFYYRRCNFYSFKSRICKRISNESLNMHLQITRE